MASHLRHFSINADDVDATKRFYESVFGWRFHALGPPGFYEIQTGPDDDPGVRGALQQRRALVEDTPMIGLECTFAVDDVDRAARDVVDAGGTVIMDRFTISGVGHLVFVRDPSGNVIGAMQYDDDA